MDSAIVLAHTPIQDALDHRERVLGGYADRHLRARAPYCGSQRAKNATSPDLRCGLSKPVAGPSHARADAAGDGEQRVCAAGSARDKPATGAPRGEHLSGQWRRASPPGAPWLRTARSPPPTARGHRTRSPLAAPSWPVPCERTCARGPRIRRRRGWTRPGTSQCAPRCLHQAGSCRRLTRALHPQGHTGLGRAEEVVQGVGAGALKQLVQSDLFLLRAAQSA
jgi:hypothetical protein